VTSVALSSSGMLWRHAATSFNSPDVARDSTCNYPVDGAVGGLVLERADGITTVLNVRRITPGSVLRSNDSPARAMSPNFFCRRGNR